MTSALLDGQSFATTVGSVVIDELAAALTAKITTADDATGTGAGTIEWALANLQVYLADLVPANELLVLTYAVTVTDLQNATSTQDIVVTISGNNGAAVVWTDTNPIPPGGALWSVASNWEGDRTPNSNGFSDDVFIGTDQVLPATPTFPVTVDATAAAKSLTMDYFTDFGTAIPELDVELTGTLTISGALNLDTSTDPLSPLTAELIIKNFGNISVGGIATLLKHSVLDNYGTITLAQGGVFGDQSSITNSGTIELTGGTLNVEVAVANSGGIIQVNNSALLKLNGAAIDGGTITDNGAIDVTGNSSINGTTTVGPSPVITNAILNNGGVTIESGVTLTLDNVTVTGTTFNDTASGAILSVDASDTLRLSGVTINGGTIDDGTATTLATSGKIEISGSSTISGASLNHGGVTIDANQTLMLDNDTVTGTTFTDTASGALIQVDDGTTLTLSGVTIDGGTVNDGTADGTGSPAVFGSIDVTGSSKIDGHAALNNGGVTIESGVTLTLDNIAVFATTLTDKGTIVLDDTVKLTGGATLQGASISVLGSITNSGTLEVAGATELLDDTLTNAAGSIIQVDALQTLTLSGAEIIGGTINDTGTIDVTGSSKIDSNATLNNGAVTIESGKILTLDKVAVTGTSIEVDGAVNTLVGQLIAQDGTTISGSHLTIDAGDQMVLNSATITGGTITDNGKIDVTGNSLINGVTTGLVTTDVILNNGGVTVESGVIVTLDNVTVNGAVFTDIATSSTIRVDSGDTLAFNGATINGGTLDVLGEMDFSGISFITGATIVNVNNIIVVGGTLTIDPTPVTNTGTIEVMGGGTLKLSDDIITNADDTTNGIIQVDAGPINPATLDLDASTISGGTVNISGVLDSSGDSFVTGAKITNTGTIDVTSGTLVIDATSTLDNTGGTLKSDGGNLIVDTAFSGNLEIKGGAVLELGANSPIFVRHRHVRSRCDRHPEARPFGGIRRNGYRPRRQ